MPRAQGPFKASEPAPTPAAELTGEAAVDQLKAELEADSAPPEIPAAEAPAPPPVEFKTTPEEDVALSQDELRDIRDFLRANRTGRRAVRKPPPKLEKPVMFFSSQAQLKLYMDMGEAIVPIPGMPTGQGRPCRPLTFRLSHLTMKNGRRIKIGKYVTQDPEEEQFIRGHAKFACGIIWDESTHAQKRVELAERELAAAKAALEMPAVDVRQGTMSTEDRGAGPGLMRNVGNIELPNGMGAFAQRGTTKDGVLTSGFITGQLPPSVAEKIGG